MSRVSMYLNFPCNTEEADSREEADALFDALADGGTVEMPMQDMFWGAYDGSLKDRFGVLWMVNHTNSA
jgi:PhnB protein